MKTNGISFQACPEPATSIPIPRSQVAAWLSNQSICELVSLIFIEQTTPQARSVHNVR
jgi:hypothetical protein